MKSFFFKRIVCLLVIIGLFPVLSAFAQSFDQDLYIQEADVTTASNIIKGDSIRIYVKVHNRSSKDLSGVVKFYDERINEFVAQDQPISVLSWQTDDVFIDFISDVVGEHLIAVRMVPWISEGDDPGNNKVTHAIYVDRDTDGDGIGDRLDPDDDNDGVNDDQDDLPFDPSETVDTDGDGIGDNADTDDDNDGISDLEDIFPLDPSESNDSDGDGTGDNQDPFPYDSLEWMDTDGDGLGDNADPDDENHGPIPSIGTRDTTVRAEKSLTFNALKSRDPDGEIITYEWDFGDGTVDTGLIVDHVFKKPGRHLVTLKVMDDRGETREQQIEIRVQFSFLTILLIIVTILLIFLLFGLVIPGSRFHHSKLFKKHYIKRMKGKKG